MGCFFFLSFFSPSEQSSLSPLSPFYFLRLEDETMCRSGDVWRMFGHGKLCDLWMCTVHTCVHTHTRFLQELVIFQTTKKIVRGKMETCLEARHDVKIEINELHGSSSHQTKGAVCMFCVCVVYVCLGRLETLNCPMLWGAECGLQIVSVKYGVFPSYTKLELMCPLNPGAVVLLSSMRRLEGGFCILHQECCRARAAKLTGILFLGKSQ